MNAPSEIILIADPRILAVPLQENNEPLIDLKETGCISFGPPPERPESLHFYTKIRKTVFEKLLNAQELLPKGIRFELYEGFRSLALQKVLFEMSYQKVKGTGKFSCHEEIFMETTKLVSPVQSLSGEVNVPPHSTGGAFDVSLIDDKGEKLDMGMSIDEWANATVQELTYTYAPNISIEAKANRALMIDALTKSGFVNYPTEWWHWSYGDRYWAYHTGHSCAIYGGL